MASLKYLALTVFCLLATVVVGQLLPPNDDQPRVIVSGVLLAHNFTDGTAVLTGGSISATSMNLRGNLWGKQAKFVGLTAQDTEVQNLHTESASLKELDVQTLTVSGDATFQADVSINGSLVAGASTLNQTTAKNLTVRGDWNIQGLLSTPNNIQVTADVNAGGHSMLHSDILANKSVTIQGNLTVAQNGYSESLYVSRTTRAGNVLIDDMARINDLLVNSTADFGANLNLGGNLSANGNVNFKLALSANDANIVANLSVGINATIGGDIQATNAQFSDVTATGDSTIGGSLSSGGKIQVNGSTSVSGSVAVTGDILARDLVQAVTGHFTTLDVDTATIVSLTSTFVTASSVHTVDSTVLGNFIVNGPSTMDTLTVKSSSTLHDVNADSVTTGSLTAENATVDTLTVTGPSSFKSMNIKSMLVAGRPSQTTGFSSSVETGFSDNITVVVSQGQTGQIQTLVGTTLYYSTISGTNGTFTDTQSDNANFTTAKATNGWVENLWTTEGTITHLTSVQIDAQLINATSDSTITELTANNLTSVTLTSAQGYLGTDVSQNVLTETVQATSATLNQLTSTSGTISWLQVGSGTVETLTADSASLQAVGGDQVAFSQGNIQTLTTINFQDSLMYNVTQGASTDWLFADFGELSQIDARTLYVTDSAWLQNATFNGDAQVYGASTFQKGFLAGESVLAALTVVSETTFSELNVAGPSFLTDLWVKRVSISDSFDATQATLGMTNATTLTTTNNATLTGSFNVTSKDSLMMGNLVVTGTTQFQTGSFSRIGTAVITTTDMEAFYMDVANGLFGAITTDQLVITKAAIFDRSISLAPMMGSPSASTHSFFTSIAPSVLTGYDESGKAFTVNAQTIFHSGQATVDQLVVTSPSDPTTAALRITGDGSVDFLEGALYFRNLDINGGVTFDNQQNVAWSPYGVTTTRSLSMTVPTFWFTYSDLIDRELDAPGRSLDPATFGQPSSGSDLITLAPGHYRVSASVKFATNSLADAAAVVVATAGIDAFSGTQSGGSVIWTQQCVASFGTITGVRSGGTCYFSGIVNVAAGQTTTLRTRAEWNYSSTPLTVSLVVDPASTVSVEQLFPRTSQNLS